MIQFFGNKQAHSWGLRIGPHYWLLKSPLAPAYFSERNRFGVGVYALGGGWRILYRRDKR